MELYSDRWISCDDQAITIRAYYFPWGSKRIAYGKIRSAVVVPTAVLSGKARMWGTTNPTLWASLDPNRPARRRALILDIGNRICPLLTPDDIDAVAQIVDRKTSVTASREDRGAIV